MKSSKLSSRKFHKQITDPKDLSFIKTYGELHPINDVEDERQLKVQIVKDDEDDHHSFSRAKRGFRKHPKKDEDEDQSETKKDLDEDNLDEMIAPYQKLLNELNADTSTSSENKRKREKATKQERKKAKMQEKIQQLDDSQSNLSGESSNETEEDEIESQNGEPNSYSQEVLCKDALETEEAIKNDPFHLHFEQNLEEKLVEKLKTNLNDRTKLHQLEQKLKWPGLGNFVYSPPTSETKLNLSTNEDLKSLFIKQRLLDRLNESIREFLGNQSRDDQQDEPPETEENEKPEPHSKLKFNLDRRQLELLNLISNYVDFYDPDVDINFDDKNKFVYTIHALNHALKTRSRIIAHNDKLKQSKESREIEYRDQGLTRPKVLILVPFRKFALKIVKIIIRLLMRPNEEFVSNKKRFFDSFGPSGDEKEARPDEDEVKKMEVRDEDFYMLFSGNTEDHFKLGISVSKKSLKLFTEFYSSDIIIASPLGLRSVISGEGEAKDYDFLSSIELLVVDNADVLLMQNWEHVSQVLEHLHLQPKKSHDVDYSRVRPWLLDGHAKFYRQTLVFSRIPAPPINAIFNKHCSNFSGKCQIDLLAGKLKYQTGTICRIGFQLGQVFHRVECDSPLQLPDARFQFFVDKILPKFRDEMMAHTLVFIPSYFDFVKIRNHFKKNDITAVNISEYTDDKGVNRSRYLFYHGKVHFMLVTERFHFYKRYKLRGINHLVFYELPSYAEFYSTFCNFLPDPKRFKNGALENFSSTVLYSKFDVQKLCAVVGHQRATHMINSDKGVHMFMTE